MEPSHTRISRSHLVDVSLKIINLYFKRDVGKWLIRTFIAAGIGLVSSPLWWPLFESFIQRYFDVTIPAVNETAGWILIVLGLVIYLINPMLRKISTPRAVIKVRLNVDEIQMDDQTLPVVTIKFENVGESDARNVKLFFKVLHENECLLDEPATVSNGALLISARDSLSIRVEDIIGKKVEMTRQLIHLLGYSAILDKWFVFFVHVVYEDDSTVRAHTSPTTRFEILWRKKFPDNPFDNDLTATIRGPYQFDTRAR